MKKIIVMILATILAVTAACALAEEPDERDSRLPVKVLVLPKFEVDEMAGDFPGEAQFYYEGYLTGSEEYDVPNSSVKLYYKDGVALALLDMGKINAALNTMAILSDSRFDYSDAYILSVGCGGSAYESTVMGDVFIITAAVNYDLGHHADPRETTGSKEITWFRDGSFDSAAMVILNGELMDKVYALVKDTPVKTTENTRNYMRYAFDGAEWALRDPQVLRGTAATGDNYWKGIHDHMTAVHMVESYGCPDPFMVTEMEEVGVAFAVKQMGMLDRLIIIRNSVNMDVFMGGNTPETLWGGEYLAIDIASEENIEGADIFETSMKNNFDVGRIIIDKILEGGL